MAALVHLAQGYHSYHLRDKVGHYVQSRELLSEAACLLALLGEDGDPLSSLADELQAEPLSAITGLIRSFEERKGKGKAGRDQRSEA